VFCAHAKGDGNVEDACEIIRHTLQDALYDRIVDVTPGKTDFDAYFYSTCGGNWKSWQNRAGGGCIYGTQTPIYHAIVCPTDLVGRATAGIVETALQRRRPVLLLLPAASSYGFAKVVSVTQLDGDQKNWARLET
jgi:hypothetical protein